MSTNPSLSKHKDEGWPSTLHREKDIAFNTFYYNWSPYVIQIIHKNCWLKTLFKIILYPLIRSLLLAINIVQPIIFLN